MKKVLFIATVVKTHIMPFHLPYLEWFQKQGYEVHVCARNDYQNKEDCIIPFCDTFYEIPFERSPLKLGNITAYRKLKRVIDRNHYEIIHCHTPIGGALGRLAAKKARRNGTKVIYTAHGFHFFEGAKSINWKLFYPVEKYLSKYTDCLITINQEDYDNAITHKFKAGKIELIHGVGVNFNRFKPQTENGKNVLRQKYGYDSNDFILVYAGELTPRKHQDLLIHAASKLKNRIPNLVILLAGSGELEAAYKNQIQELDVEKQVNLLGFRKDIDNLMMMADVAVSASRQEGLPVNVMEAMATGLPLIVTDCRGNRDLVTNNSNGYVVGIDETEDFSAAIEKLYQSSELRKSFSARNLVEIQKYSLEKIILDMQEIYETAIE